MGAAPCGMSVNRPHCAITPHGNFAPRIGEMPSGQRGRKYPYLLVHTPHRSAEFPYLMGAVPCGLFVNRPHCAIIPDGNFSPRIGEMPFGQRGRKYPYLLTHTPHRCAELPYLRGAVPCGLSVISLHCAITPHGNFSPGAGEMPSGQRGRKVPYLLVHTPHRSAEFPYMEAVAKRLVRELLTMETYFFKEKINSNPPPARFRTEMLPEWNSTALRTMLSPRPVPPFSRVRPSLTR